MNQHAYAARQAAVYFQFPLCAFAYGRTENERLDAIIHFSTFEAGLKRWRTLTEEARFKLIANQKNLPCDFDSAQESHGIAVCGANMTGIKINNIRSCLAKYTKLRRFTDAFQQRHGPDTLVRLRTDFVLEARDGKGITPLELSLLAAIYSVIGRKQRPVRITQDRIVWRALGYKSKDVMALELHKRKDGAKPGAKPYTDWIIRSQIKNLLRRHFFVQFTYGRRQTYYSHRMPRKQLLKMVFEMKTNKFTTDRLQRLDDKAMTDAIRNQRATLAGQPPLAPDAKPFAQTGEIPPEDVF